MQMREKVRDREKERSVRDSRIQKKSPYSRANNQNQNQNLGFALSTRLDSL
jgi:hypothetical protein